MLALPHRPAAWAAAEWQSPAIGPLQSGKHSNGSFAIKPNQNINGIAKCLYVLLMFAASWHLHQQAVSQQRLSSLGLPHRPYTVALSNHTVIRLLLCSENLYATSSGAILASDRQRRIMACVEQGYLAGSHQHSHYNQHGPLQHSSGSVQHMQQQPDASSSSSGPLGIGNLDFLNVTGLNTQHSPVRHTSLIPKSNLLVPDIPSGTLVLGVNLLCYWAISKHSRRGFGG